MLPDYFKPMLATLAEPFDSSDYTYEIKWDGYRCLAFLNGSTRLQSRNLKDITPVFPELNYLHLHFRSGGCLLDGEVIALRNGKPSFLELQKRAQLKKTDRINTAVKVCPVIYVVFDLLYCDGNPIFQKPLEERRSILRENLLESDELIVSGYINKEGRDYFKSVSEMGLEGVIAKRIASQYLPGKRVNFWLKFKRRQQENFIVCGYVIKPTSRGELSSLVLGAFISGKLINFGMVGSGFSVNELMQIQRELAKIATETCPFNRRTFKVANVVWTQPVVVCEVEYLELTDENSLRHPVFKRFRPDLTPIDCQFGE